MCFIPQYFSMNLLKPRIVPYMKIITLRKFKIDNSIII